VAVATAYFDESDSSVACVVAGVASTVDRWVDFESDWQRMLDKYKISALHMKDFAHSNGEFAEWKGDEAKRRQFIERVIDILARRCMICLGVVIDRNAFKGTIAADADITQFYANEYSTASFMSLLIAQKWGKATKLTVPVDYVFDRGNSKRKDFQRAYDYAQLIPVEAAQLGALTFADDTAVLGLQAADFVAYEACKVYTDVNKGQMRLRASLHAMLRRIRCDIAVPSEDKLAGLVEAMRKIE
jgi:hypothetical protein